jgi:hypothetical protein
VQGSYCNITEKDIQTNKQKIAEYYHYSQKGCDFTYDMYEKQNPIEPIKPVPSLRTHYVATKDLEMSQKLHSARRHTITERETARKQASAEDMSVNDNPGIPSIKKLTPIPKFINHELKNPRDFEDLISNMTERYVPAILIAPSTPCAKIIVFYHANAEDIGQAYSFCKDINEKLEVVDSNQCYFLLVEYPGYSIYPGEPSEEQIIRDIDPVWNFLTNIMNFEPTDVLVMGRSIGSGPATHFATQHPCGALVLISPFTSLKSVAKYNFGSIASSLVNQRFDNESKILNVQCPCLFLHGKEDTLIPFDQSKTLYSRLP